MKETFAFLNKRLYFCKTQLARWGSGNIFYGKAFTNVIF